ncbi:MAG: restriction endonuclease subunit S [Burkholderiales bacterium]
MSDNKNLKPGWKVWRFDQMATNVNVRIDNPSESGMEHYVGLEHLDADSLKIRRWGTPDDVEATKLMFKKGDIIFGRRRAYQRKLGVAEFDGICSAHAMVLRAKPDVVLPEFLPFFMQSDLFMNRAVEISVGSLSPTINWKTLASQEFALPPRDEQDRVVSAIKSALECELAYEEVRNAALALFRSASDELLNPTDTWKQTLLQEVANVERGKFSHRPRNLPEFFGGPYPFVQTGDIVSSTGDLRGASQMLSDEGLKYSKSFPKGSILITIAANIGYTAITVQETWCPDSVVGIVPRDGTNVRFLEYLLRTKQKYLENHVATQTAQKNINLQDLRPLRLDMPDPATQQEIADQLCTLEKAVADLDRRFGAARDFRVRLANETIGVADV